MTNTTAFTTLEPVRYEASFETLADDEAEVTQGLIDALHKIAEKVDKDEGHAFRGVHAKSHGLLFAELVVEDVLPLAQAQGVFAKPGRYPAVIRLSTPPGDLLDDKVSTPRGFAIKIIGVEGRRLPGSEGDVTQDFVMINGPTFSAPTPGKFLKNLKLLATTTDVAPGLKKALSATLRGVESLVEKTGHKSSTLISMGGHPETNILGETFYSAAALRHGDYMAKLSVAPVSPELVALTNQPVDLDDKPDGIREAVIAHFARHGGTWELRAQLCTDIDAMPIEDATVQWDEAKSPYVTVARIVAPPQPAWSAARSRAVDDGMAFSPWHGLSAHQPIGSIMRVRKAVYEASIKFRSAHNGVTIEEPKALTGLPD
ncbi:catalase family protein [soil metagenome]